jgi:hypothetical protein
MSLCVTGTKRVTERRRRRRRRKGSGAKGEFEIALQQQQQQQQQQHRHNVKWQFGVSFVRMHTQSHKSRLERIQKMGKADCVCLWIGLGFGWAYKSRERREMLRIRDTY